MHHWAKNGGLGLPRAAQSPETGMFCYSDPHN